MAAGDWADAHQCPGSQIFGQQHLRLRNNSHPVQRGRAQGLAVVDPEVAVDLHVAGDFAVGELPVLLSGRVHKSHAVMGSELRRRLGRAVPSEIVWRGAGDHAIRRELACDETGIGQVADPDRRL
jgi:hypothetical protein